MDWREVDWVAGWVFASAGNKPEPGVVGPAEVTVSSRALQQPLQQEEVLLEQAISDPKSLFVVCQAKKKKHRPHPAPC